MSEQINDLADLMKNSADQTLCRYCGWIVSSGSGLVKLVWVDHIS